MFVEKMVNFILLRLTDPFFSKPINFEIGEIIYRKYEKPKDENSSNTACDTSATDAFDFGFWYCDLLPE